MAISNSLQAHQITYRPDIDGLRAIAVLSVLLFHAFPEKVKGGFIGVDIFFVISGFLISSIIFKDLDRNQFSFVEFYARRIRRIFPALILVLASCYAFGWFALLQDEFKQLGKHIAAGAGFVSNLVLWDEVGYFDNAAETKPLLHLWSLGIEEQFYLIWPFLAYLAWRLRFNLFSLTLLVCIASFVLNINQSTKNHTLTFFSPQTRFWELFVGALIAWVVTFKPRLAQELKIRLNTILLHAIYYRHKDENNQTLADTCSFLGMGLIFGGFLLIDKEKVFPGWWALLPICGAALLIAAGSKGLFNRSVLSSPLLVWFGLISFPLYLWHWPILSLSRIIFGETPPYLVRLAAVVISVLLAWLTYKLIESPIRFGKHKGTKVIFLVLILAAVGYLGFNSYQRDGLPFRSAVKHHKINSDLLQWQDYKSTGCNDELGSQINFCIKYGDPHNLKVAIIGDSTGNSLAPGLAEKLASRGVGLINIGGWTCPPILGLVETAHWGKINKCPDAINKIYQYLAKNPSIDTVILGIFAADIKHWDVPGIPFTSSVEAKFPVIQKLLDQSIEELKKMGKKVIVTYDAPYSEITARDCIPRPGFNRIPPRCLIPADGLPDRQPNVSLFDNMFKNRTDICIFKQSDLLLDRGYLNYIDAEGHLLLRDTHHLSYLGSKKMADRLLTSSCSF